MIRFEDILETVESYLPDPDEGLLRRAYVFSAKEHKGQVRRSGEPYLVHPLAVAKILAEMRLDEVSIAVGLLHDVLEDTLTTRENLVEVFGEEIAHLVDGVTKISKLTLESREQQQAETFRKMLLASIDDIRVILVKLADRLHNMQTLDHMPADKVSRIAAETRDVYSPIANRFGMGWIRGQLEDLSFRYLQPDEYLALKSKVEVQTRAASDLIERVEKTLRRSLKAAGIEAVVSGRVKSLSSIWEKLQRKQDLDRVYDYLAFRITTETGIDCYHALGIVHEQWRPVPDRIKDFIGNPKPNLYQGLHTTVFGEEAMPFEVQIRTHEMDDIAERGVAAHWKYKEGKLTPSADDDLYRWLRQLVEWSSETKDSRQFMDNLKIDLFPDEVYTLTPGGDVLAFPRGATAVDFAYRIHTEVGNSMQGVKMNGKLVPLRTPLSNGDVVEIVRSNRARPSRDWLALAKTARARAKIRHWIQAEQADRLAVLGRRILDRELGRYKSEIGVVERSDPMNGILEQRGLSRPEDLYVEIGTGKIPVRSIIPKLIDAEELAKVDGEGGVLGRVVRKILPFRSAPPSVMVEGSGDVLTYLARCCNPVRGEAIVGYITRGKGVAVHAESCTNVRTLLSETGRRMVVDWGRDRASRYSVDLIVACKERSGMIARITQSVFSAKANILKVSARVDEGDQGHIELRVVVQGIDHLDKIISALKNVSGVLEVTRQVGGSRSA